MSVCRQHGDKLAVSACYLFLHCQGIHLRPSELKSRPMQQFADDYQMMTIIITKSSCVIAVLAVVLQMATFVVNTH